MEISRTLNVPLSAEAEELIEEILSGSAGQWLMPELSRLRENLKNATQIEMAELKADDGQVNLRTLVLQLHRGLRRRTNLRHLSPEAQDIKIFSVLFHESVHIQQGKAAKRLTPRQRKQREREAYLEEIWLWNRLLDSLPAEQAELRAQIVYFRRGAILGYFDNGGRRGKHLERR